MPVRELGTDDLLPYRRLTAHAFGGVVDETAPTPFNEAEVPLGVPSQDPPGGVPGVLAAGLRIRADRLVLGGREVRSGGIGGLAVHPAHRGGGLFGALLRAAISRSAADGQGVSVLYPSNPGIYRRAGWQWISTTTHMELPLADLSVLPRPQDRHLTPVIGDGHRVVRALYRELAERENALLVRDGPLFEGSHVSDGATEYVLVRHDSGTAGGYMSFSRRPDGQDGVGLEVHEIMAHDTADRLALLRCLGSWSTVSPRARIRLLTDDPVADLVPHGSFRLTAGPPISMAMLRVTDTRAALEQRGAPAALRGTITLAVDDPFMPEHSGTWAVTARDGAVEVTPAAPAPAPEAAATEGRASMDVRTLAYLFAGGRSVRDARRADLPIEADADATGFLDALFAGARPSVMDHF